MKLKNISYAFIAGLSLLAFAGCSKEKAKTYTIKVTDLDGEVLGQKKIKLNSYDSVLDALNDNFDVVSSKSEYGTYITSINHSIVDSKWSLMLYENGVESSTGIDGVTADDGDVFEFKNECWYTPSKWGTYDEYDVNVDIAIYHFLKTGAKELASADKDDLSNYWLYTFYNMMNVTDDYYKVNVSQEFENYIKNYDVTGHTGTIYGKYYYIAKALNVDLTNFKTAYETYLNSDSFANTYSDYDTPFEISPAYSLNITNQKITDIVNSNYVCSTEWGTDAVAWQGAVLPMFGYTNKDLLNGLTTRKTDWGSISCAIQLQAFAAFNENPRDSKYEVEGTDIIECLFDNYYNTDKKTLYISNANELITKNTAQLYASLAAYKVQRDNGEAAFIFA